MYTATHFKPRPLTSTCNWRHSSKWQHALAGLGSAGVSVTTSCQQQLQQHLLQQASLYCVDIRTTPVFHLCPFFSGSKKSSLLLLLPNEKGFGGGWGGTQVPAMFKTEHLIQRTGVEADSKSFWWAASPSVYDVCISESHSLMSHSLVFPIVKLGAKPLWCQFWFWTYYCDLSKSLKLSVPQLPVDKSIFYFNNLVDRFSFSSSQL